MLEANTYKNVKNLVQDLYATAYQDTAQSKMGNAEVLPLLNEIEKTIDSYLLLFSIAEGVHESTVTDESKRIKKEQRKKNRDETIQKEKEQNRIKAQKRNEEKDAKVFVKIGRPEMTRSQKPTVKKQKVEKRQPNEEELDMIKYLNI